MTLVEMIGKETKLEAGRLIRSPLMHEPKIMKYILENDHEKVPIYPIIPINDLFDGIYNVDRNIFIIKNWRRHFSPSHYCSRNKTYSYIS